MLAHKAQTWAGPIASWSLCQRVYTRSWLSLHIKRTLESIDIKVSAEYQSPQWGNLGHLGIPDFAEAKAAYGHDVKTMFLVSLIILHNNCRHFQLQWSMHLSWWQLFTSMHMRGCMLTGVKNFFRSPQSNCWTQSQSKSCFDDKVQNQPSLNFMICKIRQGALTELTSQALHILLRVGSSHSLPSTCICIRGCVALAVSAIAICHSPITVCCGHPFSLHTRLQISSRGGNLHCCLRVQCLSIPLT